jgi:hypothetical protein
VGTRAPCGHPTTFGGALLLARALLLAGTGVRRRGWRPRPRASHGGHFAGWAEQGFHDSGRMRAELESRFVGRLFAWVPYLYPDLDEATSEADERAAIDAGSINATGLRYVGVLGPEGDPSAGALRGGR